MRLVARRTHTCFAIVANMNQWTGTCGVRASQTDNGDCFALQLLL
jgi:hypothetical protein